VKPTSAIEHQMVLATISNTNGKNHSNIFKKSTDLLNFFLNRWGARHSPYQRLLQPDYHGEDSPRTVTYTYNGLPNSRLLANLIPAVDKKSGLNSFFSYFAYFVGTDMAHTTTSNVNCSACSDEPECFNIYLNAGDENEIEDCTVELGEVRRKREAEGEGGDIEDCKILNQECLPFARSDDVENVMDCYFKKREQYTQGTHFTDLDPLYGSTLKQQTNVRAFTDGLLRADKAS